MDDYRKQVCESIADACINNFFGFSTSQVSHEKDRQGGLVVSNIRSSISYGSHPYVHNQKPEQVKKQRVVDSQLLTKQVDFIQPGCVRPVVLVKRKTRVLGRAKKWLLSLRRK